MCKHLRLTDLTLRPRRSLHDDGGINCFRPTGRNCPLRPPGWTGLFAAGLALTQGNSDTSTVNLAYDVKRDTGSIYLFNNTAVGFLRGALEGALTAQRLLIDARLDRKLSYRLSLYGSGTVSRRRI